MNARIPIFDFGLWLLNLKTCKILVVSSDISITLDSFFKQYKTRTYKKREMLTRADEEPVGLFYLREGVVRQYAITAGGEELTLNTFKPGSLFPMAWVLNDSINSHYYEAMTEVSASYAPKNDARKFIEKSPDVLLDLVKRIYRGLDGYFMKMQALLDGNSESKLIAEILIYGRRFGIYYGNTVQINMKLKESDLASGTGLARETVSRSLKKLRDKGLINFHKNTLVVTDLKRLEEEL